MQTLGNYDLLVKLAEGGMGAVYKGRNRATGEIVAIKVVPPETARNPLLLKRFEQEFKAARLLDHPNVVKALDYCGTVSTPFLVMEFVDGETLGQKVERDGGVPEAEALNIMSQVCEGLHRAHKQGLIHRDVKPDNIMLTNDGIAKLTDLGLVKELEGELNLTKTGRGLGTPHYMAPEQFRNAKNADVRCDVYSLGATLYTLLTGAIPFDKSSPLDCWIKKTKNDFPEPKTLKKGIGERVNWAICRAMRSDPAERPGSCREFMEDLTGAGWKTAGPPSGSMNLSDDLWYVVYKDETAQFHTVKGTTDNLRQSLLAGILGDLNSVLVCRTKTGQFVPVKQVPEFRDIVVGPLTPVLAPHQALRASTSDALRKGGKGPPSDPHVRPKSEPLQPQPAKPMTRSSATMNLPNRKSVSDSTNLAMKGSTFQAPEPEAWKNHIPLPVRRGSSFADIIPWICIAVILVSLAVAVMFFFR